MPKKLDQYRGPLTPAQVADGINAADANARRLAADAELLLKHGRFPSACSLAILAIEEAGKPTILRQLAAARTGDELQEHWRDYRRHTVKNQAWILVDLARKGARTLDDYREIVDPNAEHPHVLDNLKQLGFYTDALGALKWTQPEDTIDEATAHSLLLVAKVFASKREGRAVMSREIELWVQHVGPAINADLATSRKALMAWHEAMVREGLVKNDPDFERFVTGKDGGFPAV